MLNDDSLAAGDAVAAEILASLEPLHFVEAVQERAREECFRLRYRAVLEFDLASVARFPDGLERDEFDADAVHILAADGARAVATCRVLLPSPERPLPAVVAFSLATTDVTGAVELGRVVVDPGYRGDGHSVLMGLLARAWLCMRRLGHTAAIGATPRRLITLFEALDFDVTVLGPPRSYWGEDRYPILCRARPAIPGLQRRWLAGETDASPAQPPSDGRRTQ